MNKAVLMAIRPKYCELIASGKKTIEIRKTIPKLETPFKVYMYCTQAKTMGDFILCKSEENAKLFGFNTVKGINKGFAKGEDIQLKGKVIGEFVCDDITNIKPFGFDDIEAFEKQICLNSAEIVKYLKGFYGYGWHISDLVIYDKPKELSSFYRPCPYEENDDISCFLCDKSGRRPDNAELDCFYFCEKPPQSWYYVEELSGA